MNKKLKSFMHALLALALVLVLGACSNNSSTESDSGSGESTTEQAAENQEAEGEEGEASEDVWLTVSTMGTSLPWSYIDNDGNWTGVDGAIWKEIEERSGKKIEVLKGGGFDAALGNVVSGRAQIASNHFTPTPERLNQYACTKPYSSDVAVIAIRPEDVGTLKTFEDFAGKKIAVIAGHSAEVKMRELAEEYGFEIVTYENTDPAMKDITAGRIDGFASNQTDLASYMEQTGVEYGTSDEVLEAQPAVFLVSKNEGTDTAAIIEELNGYIDDMLADGTLSKITEEYFGEDMTKYIDEAVADYQKNNNQDVSEGFIGE